MVGEGLTHQVGVFSGGFSDERLLRLNHMLQELAHTSSFRGGSKRKLIGRNLRHFLNKPASHLFPSSD
jgi:hypothetical protein